MPEKNQDKYWSIIKILYGIALILFGSLFGELIYISLPFGIAGLLLCTFTAIGAMPEKKNSDENEDKK